MTVLIQVSDRRRDEISQALTRFRAQLPITPLDVEGVSGYLVDDNLVDEFLGAFALQREGKLAPSPYRGVQIQKTVDAAKSLHAGIAVKDGSLKLDTATIDWLEGLFTQVSGHGFSKLEVWHDRATPNFPDDDTFRLCIDSSPQRIRRLEGKRSFRGSKLASGTLIAYSGLGFPINDGDCIGAELVGNNKLFVLFPCSAPLDAQKRDVLSWILAASLEVVTLSPQERERLHSLHNDVAQSKEELEFIDAVCGTADDSLVKIRQQIDDKRGQRDDIINRLVISQRELSQVRGALATATEQRDRAHQQLVSEVLQIRSHPLVQDMLPYGGGLVITTAVLTGFSHETGHTHEIGQFRIEMFPTVSNPEQSLKWYNISRVVEIDGEAFYAPNVLTNGAYHDAEAFARVVQLVREFHLAAAVNGALALLKSPLDVSQETLAAFSRNIQHWPVI